MTEPVVQAEGVITRALREQGDLKPGDEGYWKVYGATVADIQPGDLVMFKYTNQGPGEAVEVEVKAYAPRGEDHASLLEAHALVRRGGQLKDLRDMVRPRFLAADGTYFNLGALQPMQLLRKGTHNMLSDHVH